MKQNTLKIENKDEQKKQLISILTFSINLIENPEKYRNDFNSQWFSIIKYDNLLEYSGKIKSIHKAYNSFIFIDQSFEKVLEDF